MRRVSKKRAAERPARLALLRRVIERDGGCVAREGGRFDLGTPCGQLPPRAPLEGHELVRRAQMSGGHLIDENVVALCPRHHDWVTANPEAAKEVGLSVPRWEWDRAHGQG